MTTPNDSDLGTYLTGLVILAKAIPASLKDANGDPVADCLMQTAHDLANELGLSREVNWNVKGEPAAVEIISRDTVEQLKATANTFSAVLEGVLGGIVYD